MAARRSGDVDRGSSRRPRGLIDPDDIARFDEAIAADRRIVHGLLQILRAGTLEPR
jgi:hypothetical protein